LAPLFPELTRVPRFERGFLLAVFLLAALAEDFAFDALLEAACGDFLLRPVLVEADAFFVEPLRLAAVDDFVFCLVARFLAAPTTAPVTAPMTAPATAPPSGLPANSLAPLAVSVTTSCALLAVAAKASRALFAESATASCAPLAVFTTASLVVEIVLFFLSFMVLSSVLQTTAL
jgi:hypothetical protein